MEIYQGDNYSIDYSQILFYEKKRYYMCGVKIIIL